MGEAKNEDIFDVVRDILVDVRTLLRIRVGDLNLDALPKPPLDWDREPAMAPGGEIKDYNEAAEKRMEEYEKEHPELLGSGAPGPGPDTFNEDMVVSDWNRMANEHGFTKIKTITRIRKQKLLARYKEHPDFWLILRKEAGLMAKGLKRHGFFTLDWVLEPRNFLKLAEGNFRKDAQQEAEEGPPVAACSESEAIKALRKQGLDIQAANFLGGDQSDRGRGSSGTGPERHGPPPSELDNPPF